MQKSLILTLMIFIYFCGWLPQPDAIHAQEEPILPTGNVIFIHPDGTSVSHWNAARAYWYGPDSIMNWDQLPEVAVYRGHMSNGLNGTSNGGATTHAFGYKVNGEDSYGRYHGDDDEYAIRALSGYSGSIMREAASAGYPIGIVNDGDVAEPGTGVFLSEVSERSEATRIVAQFLDGRPNTTGEPQPAVILGGGEQFFLPRDIPMCVDTITPDCAVHRDPIHGNGPEREDGRNLIREAVNQSWVVIRTRGEFDALMAQLESDTSYAPQVLGLFAADDIFNDEPEEGIRDFGLIEARSPDDKRGDLVLWGSMPGTFGYNPPTAAEMTRMALTILHRRAQAAGTPFLLVSEVESTDNFANNANAIGTLRALKQADDVIGTARDFLVQAPNTLILTAADSDAGGFEILSPPPFYVDGDDLSFGDQDINPEKLDSNDRVEDLPFDGLQGRRQPPFISEPDGTGRRHPFVVVWVGTTDTGGGIVSRAAGLNAALLRTQFSSQFDNTDVYRLMYATLFGEMLPAGYGQPAPRLNP